MYMHTEKAPFIWGVQYHRAPTPDKKHWENDLSNIRKLGFTDIKYWVQWRWSHRDENSFYFDDTDELMDLAHKYGLRVTINTIFDITPSWFLEKYPDCKQIRSDGTVVEPYVSSCRQLGGMPGPCYNHDAGIAERKKFMEAVVKRYSKHPAMFMWDVWNEPEQCHIHREPKPGTQVCFCPNCREKFIRYLSSKYSTLDELNSVWGRCYTHWNQIELPRTTETFGDYIDWREFQLDTMTSEAAWRLDTVRRLDPDHAAYLHVVPNTSRIFNAVTGVDDFAMARQCDVFASTNFAGAIWSVLTTSAAEGKTAYNVECHIGTGSTNMHPRIISVEDIMRDFVPQIGMGIRGFMFWQYHSETLGFESPAWGCAKPDGSVGSIGRSAAEFIDHLKPYTDDIMDVPAPPAQIAIWKGRKNELFNYSLYGNLHSFGGTFEAYVNALYRLNYNCRIVDDAAIIGGLKNTKLLILPMCYSLTQDVADAIDEFIRRGGTVICEAHLGGYNADTNRHSEVMPGLGLHQKWGILEEETMAAYHLDQHASGQTLDTSGFTDDMKKSFEAYGVSGGKYYLIETANGGLYGAERFAKLNCSTGEIIGYAGGMPCIAKVPVENGTVYYCGTNLGEGASANTNAFSEFLDAVCQDSGLKKNLADTGTGIHTEFLGRRLLAVHNMNAQAAALRICGKSIFHGHTDTDGIFEVPANSADILVIDNND